MAIIPRSRLFRSLPLVAALGVLAALSGASMPAQDLDARLKEAEAKRVAVIEKVRPSVVAVFGRGGQGGGSGVLIDENGYALTNFHVTAGAGNLMKCGLPDGVLYDAVLVGLDKVGDVALIKLLPKKDGQKFPFAPLGDSDKLRAGDWSLAMGNPFLLATDFTPTVTFGLISGVHRYQYPANTLLEYTDCIQIDTSINPGNSGGPLFNMKGELVGINGRGSFDKRTRINSGVGYAISINQIKNFLPHLRSGLDTDHASLGATIESDNNEGEGANPKMIVRSILDSADASRRGLETDDELVSFAGRPMGSVNQYKNALGLYPRGWRVPIVFRRQNQKHEVLVRLMGVQRQEIPDDDKKPAPPPTPPVQPLPPSPASKYFESKPGFANYYFNREAQKRLLAAFAKHGDFSGLKGEWTIKGTGEADNRETTLEVNMKEEGTETLVHLKVLGLDYDLKPLKVDIAATDQKAPPKSGGLISAMYLYRQLLLHGSKGFIGEFSHGGQEPFYPPTPKGAKPDFNALKTMAEVLRTRHAGVSAKWYFSLKDSRLLGFEVSVDRDDASCEVYLSDYRAVGGRMLPHKMEVRHGHDSDSPTATQLPYAEFTDLKYELKEK
ncbi:MAG TPA: trypsin-like peptidase domain-containing protein [Gemmataceae bacterium]|nr:trypsin-like peptidase domain-containing protein [Gemmataceae bacterium]